MTVYFDSSALVAVYVHRAEDLSRRWTPKTLARTLDVLHVAALIEIGYRTLVSGDERQIALARREGLRVFDIRGRP